MRNALTQIHLSQEQHAQRAIRRETSGIRPSYLCIGYWFIGERNNGYLFTINSCLKKAGPRPFGIHYNMIGQTAFFLPIVPVFWGSRSPIAGQFRHPRRFICHNLLFHWSGIDLSECGFPAALFREPENVPCGVTVSKNNQLRFQRFRFRRFSFSRQVGARPSLEPAIARDYALPF